VPFVRLARPRYSDVDLAPHLVDRILLIVNCDNTVFLRFVNFGRQNTLGLYMT